MNGAHVKGWTKYNQLVNSKADRLQQAKQVYYTQLYVLKSYQKQRLKCTMKSVLKVTETIHVQIL